MSSTCTEVIALIDWDNVEGSFNQPESDGRQLARRHGADEVAFELRERLLDLMEASFSDATELEIRCYSGWFEPSGHITSPGRAIRGKIDGMGGRVRGRPVRFEFADSMYAPGSPALQPLLVPRSCRCPHRSPIREQKMVDTFMTVDAVYLAEFSDIGVITVSDDVDLAPGMAMAAMQRTFIAKRPAIDDFVWLRRARATRQTKTLVSHITIEEW